MKNLEKITPYALVILDGFGISSHKKYNAIAQAQKPTLDYLWKNYPHALLKASGSAVGLPDGYMGNSEVGHMTLGAGRIVSSDFLRFHTAIARAEFFTNPVLTQNLIELAQSGHALHIMGLLSDAGIQGHQEMIYALIEAGLQHSIQKIVVHAFLDGRDVPPKSAATYLTTLQEYVRIHPQVHIGSITGRYYAMDRNNNWDRTDAAYAMLTTPAQPRFATWQDALATYYAQGVTDEFILPTLLDGVIQENDGLIFANFREDRSRQLAERFNSRLDLAFFITAIRYSQDFKNPVLLEIKPIVNTLKKILSKAGKTIFAIAETEKYAHVTYFFGGGQEKAFPGETRMLIPSLSYKTYAGHPHMSAQGITNAVIHSLQQDPKDFYLINYANADMVGHSGDLQAAIKAIECLDHQIAQLYEQIVQKMGGTLIITADHGNAEDMYDEKTGQPKTTHTTNPVPFIWINNKQGQQVDISALHQLADDAPFIIKQMGLAIPSEMNKTM